MVGTGPPGVKARKVTARVSESMRVALFGGSFNPPHMGHLLAAAYVRAVAEVDALWLMPAHRHPFNKALAPWDDRLALCRALASHLTGVEVTEVERDVPGDGRTIDTIDHLRRLHPEHEWRLVVGTDILTESHKWKEFDRLVTLAPLLVLARGGYETHPALPAGSAWLGEVPMPRVSSTEVRERLRTGRDASALVAARVLDEVRARGLYRDP